MKSLPGATRSNAAGPDNEPLIDQMTAVAWVDSSVAEAARGIIEGLNRGWGSLHRSD